MSRTITGMLAFALSYLACAAGADAAFALYASEINGNKVTVFDPSGASSPFIPSVSSPAGIAFSPVSGNFFAATQSPISVQQYSPTGTPFGTFTNTNLSGVEGIAFDSSGRLFVVNQSSGSVTEYSPTGSFLRTFASGLSSPLGILIDAQNRVFVTQTQATNAINEYDSSGNLLGILTSTRLNNPAEMVLDSGGNLYVTNSGNGVIEKFSSTGVDSGAFATGVGGAYGLAYDPSTGIFYQSNFIFGNTNNTIVKYSSTGAPLGTFATGLNGAFFLTSLGSVTAVPEPSSLALCGIAGLMGIAYARRYRKAV